MRNLFADRTRGFGAGFMLASLLAAFAVFAQEPDGAADRQDEIDALEPGVETSATDATDDVDPAVPTAVLAADVTRSRSGGQVMDRMELGRTEITGNQELPKVLYIVPWKKADLGNLMIKPVNSLLDEVLAPIDREEFVRSVDYYDDIYGSDNE